MSCVNVIVGTSAGALLAALLALGSKLDDVLAEALKTPLLSHVKIDFDGFLQNYGLDKGEGLQQFIDNTLGCNMTFKHLLEATGKRLVIVTTCVETRKTKYFDADTTPNCSVNTAVRISCSVPLMFGCVKYEGNTYVDGGLTNNFAIDCPHIKNKTTLGMSVQYDQPQHLLSLSSYLGALFGIAVVQHKEASQDTDCLPIRVGSCLPLDMPVDAANIQALVDAGREAARQFVS